jgi:tartrate dehydrogenase/decarboxylase/D-malate dehydrogenase
VLKPNVVLTVAAIPGDGIGIEVIAAGRRVLDAVAETSDDRFSLEWTEFPWGSAFFAETGKMMPDGGVNQLREFDAIYFGAVGWPTVPDHVSL